MCQCTCITERVCVSGCVNAWDGWVTQIDKLICVYVCGWVWEIVYLQQGHVAQISTASCRLFRIFCLLVAQMILKSLKEAVLICATCPSCKKNPHLAAALSLARAYVEQIHQKKESRKNVSQEPDDWEDLIWILILCYEFGMKCLCYWLWYISLQYIYVINILFFSPIFSFLILTDFGGEGMRCGC